MTSRDVVQQTPHPAAALQPVRNGSGEIVELVYTSLNDAALRLYGMSSEDVVGSSLLELFPSARRTGILDAALRAIHTQDRVDIVVPWVDPDGVEQTFTQRAVPHGTGVVLTSHDVTATMLAESNRRFRQIAGADSDVVYTHDVDGVVEWVTPSVTEVLGWARDDFIGVSRRQLIHPDDLAIFVSGWSAKRKNPSGAHRVQMRFATIDGTWRWMAVFAHVIRDDHGEVIGAVEALRDVQSEVEALQALQRSVLDLRAAQRMAGLASWKWNPTTDEVVWASELSDMFGIDSDVRPPNFAEQTTLYGAASLQQLRAAIADATTTGASYDLELEFVRSDSSRGWMRSWGEPVLDDRGAIVEVRGYAQDITDQVEARRALASSETLFRTAMLASPIGMAMSELDGSFRMVNQSLCELLGRDEAWLTAHTIQDVTHPNDVELLMRDWQAVIDGAPVTEFEPLRLVNADDEILRVKRAAELIVDASGRPDYLLVQYVDTTAEHAALEDLAHQASHDPLTGLRNRTGIMDLLEADLRAPTEVEGRVGVLFIDLDNFKIVNDSLGHAAGDEVLVAVANRITGVLWTTDRFGRSGGDEFIVVVPDVTDAARAERIAEQIVSAVGTELMIHGHRIVPTVSIGVALSVAGSTSASLLRDADAALFRAKAAGRSRWQVFDDAMHTQALGRLTIEDEVRRGLGANEFVVHYQPIVTLADRRVVGHEALVRWEHSTRGLLAPIHFLETAEDSGLIVGIGQHVLEHVCALLASRPDLPGPISVNFSPVQLAHADWLQNFTETLSRHGVDPARIVVEVTETAVMTLLPGTRDDLLALRDLGVGLHVDDFGTGFSSISLLRDMPVTGLKLDKSFVADLSDDDDAASALSTGLAGLVSGLHLTGIAEGVESEVQHRVLLGQGWSHGQGYLYGRPSPQPTLTGPEGDGQHHA